MIGPATRYPRASIATVLSLASCVAVTVLIIGGERHTWRPVQETVGHASPPIEMPTLTLAELDDAVDRDPFNRSRQRPVERYRPDQRTGIAAPEDPAVPVPAYIPNLVLVGTSVGGRQTSAILQVGDAAPRIVAEGDTVDGVHIRRVSAGRLSVAIGDSSLVLFVKYSPDGNR